MSKNTQKVHFFVLFKIFETENTFTRKASKARVNFLEKSSEKRHRKILELFLLQLMAKIFVVLPIPIVLRGHEFHKNLKDTGFVVVCLLQYLDFFLTNWQAAYIG